MQILVIGGSGTIGSAVVKELAKDTDLITASPNSGDYKVNLDDFISIDQLFKNIKNLDGIVCAASRGIVFKPIIDMSINDYLASMQQKLLGQISLTLKGAKVLNDGGSITLTTGVMNRDFVEHGSAVAMVNHAVEGFVKAAALDMPRGIRINAVSPALLEESVEKYADLCPGFEPVSSEKVARAYRRSIYGIQTGQVFQVQ
tara:strand:+ start:149 stop:751 length:603 start_codon:yes stop_codon:yes gene_type:complete